MDIWVLNRWEAERHLASWLSQRKKEKKIGIILIAGHHEELHELPDELLMNERVEFLSLIFPDDDCSFTEEHAKKVWSFIEEVQPQLLIVSCQEGKSRSPAIALAIDEVINEKRGSPFWKFGATLNRHVYKVMKVMKEAKPC